MSVRRFLLSRLHLLILIKCSTRATSQLMYLLGAQVTSHVHEMRGHISHLGVRAFSDADSMEDPPSLPVFSGHDGTHTNDARLVS